MTGFPEPSVVTTDMTPVVSRDSTKHAASDIWRSGRLPCLDGWRAVAIIIVIGSHCNRSIGFPPEWHALFEWIFYGRLGVRFFFVLSGFLITLLMLREQADSGKFCISAFWVRRSLRIFPVYYAHLLVLFALQRFTTFDMPKEHWIQALTFTYNYGEGQWLPGHIWSLCVEEQFYLAWPIMFLLIGNRLRMLTVIAVLVILSAAGCRVLASLGASSPLFGWASLFTNMDALAVGGVTSYLVLKYGHTFSGIRPATGLKAATLGVLLILVPYVLWKLQIGGFIIVPLGPILQSIGFATLMVISVLYHDHWSTGWLRNRVAAQIGVLSYSIYIWQQLFCTTPDIFGLKSAWILSFPQWIPAAFFCGAVSYYAVELPFLKLKRRFEKRSALAERNNSI